MEFMRMLFRIKNSSMGDVQLNSEYNFLVLVDFSEASYISLKFAITMTKQVGGNLRLFHVADGEEMARTDSHIVALRSVDRMNNEIEDKLKAIAEMIEGEGISVAYEYSYGNVKNKINNHIATVKPDMVILGRRTQNRVGKITRHFLKSYSGCALITGVESEFSPTTNISLACSKTTPDNYNLSIVYGLHQSVKPPLSVINVLTDYSDHKDMESVIPLHHPNKMESTLRYHHSLSSNVAEGLVEHVSEDSVGMLCIGREINGNWVLKKLFSQPSIPSEIIENITIPILLLAKK